MGGVKKTQDVRKTLIAVLASHDSWVKNSELALVFKTLYERDKKIHGKSEDKYLLGKFHFVFTGGTFKRLMCGAVLHDS